MSEGVGGGTGGSSADLMSREAEGQQGAEQLPVAEKFSSVGRSSLDIFSPAREGETLLARSSHWPVSFSSSICSRLNRLSDLWPGWGHALWKDTW